MDIARAAGSIRITAQDYLLEVRQDPPRAVLADRTGRIWSALSLLTDLDCTSARDETYEGSQPQVDADGECVMVSVAAESLLWRSKLVTLRCTDERLELTVTVEGHGLLTFGCSAAMGYCRTGRLGRSDRASSSLQSSAPIRPNRYRSSDRPPRPPRLGWSETIDQGAGTGCSPQHRCAWR
jgi:hypothetical protein